MKLGAGSLFLVVLLLAVGTLTGCKNPTRGASGTARALVYDMVLAVASADQAKVEALTGDGSQARDLFSNSEDLHMWSRALRSTLDDIAEWEIVYHRTTDQGDFVYNIVPTYRNGVVNPLLHVTVHPVFASTRGYVKYEVVRWSITSTSRGPR